MGTLNDRPDVVQSSGGGRAFKVVALVAFIVIALGGGCLFATKADAQTTRETNAQKMVREAEQEAAEIIAKARIDAAKLTARTIILEAKTKFEEAKRAPRTVQSEEKSVETEFVDGVEVTRVETTDTKSMTPQAAKLVLDLAKEETKRTKAIAVAMNPCSDNYFLRPMDCNYMQYGGRGVRRYRMGGGGIWINRGGRATGPTGRTITGDGRVALNKQQSAGVPDNVINRNEAQLQGMPRGGTPNGIVGSTRVPESGNSRSGSPTSFVGRVGG